MKLIVPASIILSISLLVGNASFSQVSLQPGEIITDYKNNGLALITAGGNILFSIILSKASLELPSLATGIYFVRVKNKVSGEATNLHYVKTS